MSVVKGRRQAAACRECCLPGEHDVDQQVTPAPGDEESASGREDDRNKDEDNVGSPDRHVECVWDVGSAVEWFRCCNREVRLVAAATPEIAVHVAGGGDRRRENSTGKTSMLTLVQPEENGNPATR